MKNIIPFIVVYFFSCPEVYSQCSLCTKTAQQLGEKPALGMNQGILYLMFTPFLIMGVIAYRWWKNQNNTE